MQGRSNPSVMSFVVGGSPKSPSIQSDRARMVSMMVITQPSPFRSSSSKKASAALGNSFPISPAVLSRGCFPGIHFYRVPSMNTGLPFPGTICTGEPLGIFPWLLLPARVFMLEWPYSMRWACGAVFITRIW